MDGLLPATMQALPVVSISPDVVVRVVAFG
jgi:hypothetical protein